MSLRIASAPRVWLPGKSVPYKKSIHVLHAKVTHRDADNNILWVSPGYEHNILHDEGEQYILSTAFNTGYANYGVAPAALYLGVDNRASLAEADTLATLTGEPAVGGYARKQINTDGSTTGSRPFFTFSQPAAYYQGTLSSNVSWTPNANWGNAVKNIFLGTHLTAVTSASGQRLIASVAMSASRQVNNGDTLSANLVIGMNE